MWELELLSSHHAWLDGSVRIYTVLSSFTASGRKGRRPFTLLSRRGPEARDFTLLNINPVMYKK